MAVKLTFSVERKQAPLRTDNIREPRPFHRTAEHGELLPKSGIVESQLATSLEGRDESANKRRNHPGMLPAEPRVLPPSSVGEMTLRLYGALSYSQNSACDLRRALNGA